MKSDLRNILEKGRPIAPKRLWVVLVVFACFSAKAEEEWLHDGIFTHEIPLTGEASGGVLSATRLFAQDAKFITVPTTAGEGGEEVAQRLSAAALSVPGMYVTNINNLIVAEGSEDAALVALAGTETGFGIPSTPKSLSANFDDIGDGVTLCWEGVNDYDVLAIHGMGDKSARIRNASSCVYLPRANFGGSTRWAYFHVVAYKNNVPSNAARILMQRHNQEDMTLIPFTDGVWPNWTKWDLPGQERVTVRQADRDPIPSPGKGGTGHRSYAQFAPFYQGMLASESSYCGGIYRRFLGLESGATYKVAARLNTFGQESSTNWAYSVHAAHSAPDNSLLTSQQLAGTAPLPDGSQGVTAGQFGTFGESDVTEGFWIECATDGTCPGREIGNIQLPAGVTSLTIWVRLTGSNTVVDDVGIDWVSIEKLP